MVSESTIRKDVYEYLYTLVNTNKLSGTTVLSSFLEKNPIWPCIIINPALVSVEQLGVKIDARIQVLRVEFDFYAIAVSGQGKEMVDKMRDNVMNTILNNESGLYSNQLVLNSADFWDDSNTDSFKFNEQNLHTASSILKLTLRG